MERKVKKKKNLIFWVPADNTQMHAFRGSSSLNECIFGMNAYWDGLKIYVKIHTSQTHLSLF